MTLQSDNNYELPQQPCPCKGGNANHELLSQADGTQPCISVLMTVFNAESYLAASIESILKQTFTDWEFLIVDDASTDRSVEIAENYAAKDHRIRIVRNDHNKGQTACLNQGLKEARGRWIARQDADDLSHPLRFEKQFQRIQEEPLLVLLGTSGLIIDRDDHLIGLLDPPLTQELIVWSMPFLNPFLHTAVLFNTEVVRALGGYDEQYRIAQDYDLWTRIIDAGYPAVNLPERLVSYRHLESSLSKVGQSKAFEEAGVISHRLEKKAFGRSLNQGEQQLLASFRCGLKATERKLFWKLYYSLQSSLARKKAEVMADRARLTAIYHLKIAGCCAGHWVAITQEVVAACIAKPRFVLVWLYQRLASQKK